MSLRMIQPSVHPRSRFYWFRRRVPKRYRAYGMPAEVKFSLETADYDEALLRCQEHNLRLEREWRAAIDVAPVSELSHLQIVALAGEFHREMVATHRDEPGAASVTGNRSFFGCHDMQRLHDTTRGGTSVRAHRVILVVHGRSPIPVVSGAA